MMAAMKAWRCSRSRDKEDCPITMIYPGRRDQASSRTKVSCPKSRHNKDRLTARMIAGNMDFPSPRLRITRHLKGKDNENLALGRMRVHNENLALTRTRVHNENSALTRMRVHDEIMSLMRTRVHNRPLLCNQKPMITLVRVRRRD